MKIRNLQLSGLQAAELGREYRPKGTENHYKYLPS